MNTSSTAPLSIWKIIGLVLLILSGLALGALIGMIIGVFTDLIPFSFIC
jgi:hypothetical protein